MRLPWSMVLGGFTTFALGYFQLKKELACSRVVKFLNFNKHQVVWRKTGRLNLSPYHLGQASDGDNLKDSAAQLMATRISELEVTSVKFPMELAFVLMVNCGKVRNIRHLLMESTKTCATEKVLL